MNDWLKKILLFCLVFIFIYPIFPKGFPIPLDRILQVIGFGVLVFHPDDIKRIIKSKLVRGFSIITGVILLLAVITQLQTKGEYDLYFIKLTLNTFLNCFSAYLILWWAKKCYKNISFGLILYYVVLTAIAQVFISAFFFAFPEMFYKYITILNEKTNQGLLERAHFINRRFMGLGSQFFGAVIKIGIAYIAIIILPFFHKNKFTENKFLYWTSVLIIGIGGYLTARTFLFAIILGAVLFLILNYNQLKSIFINGLKMFLLTVAIFIGAFFTVNTLTSEERYPEAYHYTFEIFINLFLNKKIETTSTDTLKTMYVYPDNTKTWLFGDGKMKLENGKYYMSTDVGYLRLIFYFGLPATIVFAFCFFGYYRCFTRNSPYDETRHQQQKALQLLIAFVFVWFFILNFKGLVFESRYLSLFMVALLVSGWDNRLPKEVE